MDFNVDLSKRKMGAILTLLMIPGYVLMIFALPANISTQCEPQVNPERGVTDKVGVCTEVSATVMRQYYFDTVRLPVHTLGLNLDLLNKIFVPLFLVISGFLWREYI